jgi:hypothetical protein
MDEQTCLSPIANAVETIEGRAAAITAELQAEPNPNPNSLQGLLQGALLLRTPSPPFTGGFIRGDADDADDDDDAVVHLDRCHDYDRMIDTPPWRWRWWWWVASSA